MSMGHGDEIVLADGNFPAASVAKANNNVLIRADGHNVCSLLKSIMQFFPLDKYDDNVFVMDLVPGDLEKLGTPVVWKEFEAITRAAEGNDVNLTPIERFAFYERAKKAFCVVATSDTALYGNIILKKGVIS